MSCVGIVVEVQTGLALFNPQLAIAQGYHVITNNKDVEPEVLKKKVEAKLRMTIPHVTLKFLDHYDELEVEKPVNDYILLICQESPMYSGSMH